MNRREAFIAMGGGVASLWFVRDASAWVPSGSFILDMVHDRRKNMSAMAIKGQLFIYDDSLKDGRRQVEQTLYMKMPSQLRVEVKGPKGDYFEVADGKRKITVRNGEPGDPGKDVADLWRALMIADGNTIKAVASARGVDLSKVGLGRLPGPGGEPRRGEVCYVIGATGSGDAAMIWVDKSNYYPRLIKDAGDKDPRVVTFDGWESQIVKGWFPATTIRKRGDKLVEELIVDEVKTNPKLDTKLFDVAAAAVKPKPKK